MSSSRRLRPGGSPVPAQGGRLLQDWETRMETASVRLTASEFSALPAEACPPDLLSARTSVSS